MNGTWLLAVALKPLAFTVVLTPLVMLRRRLERTMKEGKLKRLLLRRLS